MRTTVLIGIGGVVVCLLAGCAPTRVSVPAEAQLAFYDARPYRDVLDGTVRGGDVDYPLIANTDGRRAALDRYLDALARFGPQTDPPRFATDQQKLAYYLNAYNAFMLKLWLNEGAGEADGDESVGWTTWFFTKRFVMDGRTVTLHELEQGIIRPNFTDARLHAALVCGAISCPPLRDEPYVGDRLDAQLDDQMRAWLHSEQRDGLRIDQDGDVLFSRIFKWYRDDFRDYAFGAGGAEMTGLAGMVRHYLDDGDPRKAAALEALADGDEAFLGYDWTINLAD